MKMREICAGSLRSPGNGAEEAQNLRRWEERATQKHAKSATMAPVIKHSVTQDNSL
jgi:hypothetical protein